MITIRAMAISMRRSRGGWRGAYARVKDAVILSVDARFDAYGVKRRW